MGLDIAPAGFVNLAGDLLVSNFRDRTISTFNRLTVTYCPA